MKADAGDGEAARQVALLAAIRGVAAPAQGAGLKEPVPRAQAGIAVYRANVQALAERALSAATPTLHALLGADDFAHLAREFLREHPPQRGDIGEWGGALPDWLRRHAGLSEWPYLGDCAALDLARHRAERARDAEFDAASLTLLESNPPEELRLVLMPGLAVVNSQWPVVTLFEAHAAPGAALDQARAALAQGCAEAALVARDGWRAKVVRIDAPTFAWTHDLLHGALLADALRNAVEGFEFAAWLASALRERWLERVANVGRR